MSKIHLIVGNVGAGKSTYASILAQQERAHIFTIDDWMGNLFWMDAPEEETYQWALERTVRIEKQILKETQSIVSLGVHVILDMGFFSKEQRRRVIEAFDPEPNEILVHYLDVDQETRWQRVEKRNLEKTGTYRFEVPREIFDFCETIFEPLTSEELPQDVELIEIQP
ncbi:AAA family ATPase [Curvivirga sp.]|uniref:AAA family ATPase n=1 Tax=Curvivirga sp. TaxID=2856848 RepID=UPI003B5A4582